MSQASLRRRSVAAWLLGARPRTLGAAVVPVAVGTAAAGAQLGPARLIWWRAALALFVAVAVQVGTNFANDYSDGVRGTDETRVGPPRLVASGLVTPQGVRRAALASYAAAAVAGVALSAATSWWLVAVGAACFCAGWLYSGGPAPYGHRGLGELFVFLFFGVVATVGAAYVQEEKLRSLPFAAAAPVGLLAVALLEANNLRDVAGDERCGKRTLAVRAGRDRAAWLYIGALAGALAGVVMASVLRPGALLALVAAPLAIAPIRTIRRGAEGVALRPVLGWTGRLQLAGGVLLAIGLIL